MNRRVLSQSRIALIAFTVHLATLPLIADEGGEKTRSLPRPGAWARYHVVRVEVDGTETTYDETIEWQARELSADGKPLRWIEIRSEFDEDAELKTYVVRMLVPENALMNDPDPLKQTVKLMFGVNDEPLADEDVTSAPFFYHAVIVCPGSKTDVHTLDDPKIVMYQPGNLSITKESTVTHVWTRRLKNADGNLMLTYDYTFYSHGDVEACFAQASFTISYQLNDELPNIQRFNYYLTTAGWKEPAE